MWSFEIYHVFVTQKLRSLLGGSKAAIVALEPPAVFSISELYQSDVPQKILFFE